MPNQLQMLLSGLAYTLIEAIRRLALKNTSLFKASCGTIRLKLFKIGAIVLKNTRRVQMFLSPYLLYFLSGMLVMGKPENGKTEAKKKMEFIMSSISKA